MSFFVKTIIYFLIFSVFGISMEIFWSAFIGYFSSKNPRLMGKSTLWMFPIYGSILFIVTLTSWVYGSYPWWFRGLIYMFLILIWEYFSGLFVRLLVGVSPWDYAKETSDGIGSPKKFNLDGLICLEYAPLWFILGLVAESLYIFLETHLIL
jgi:hypothetical protein